ncbi:MAG TPA: hypothetical protein QGF58_14810 [Myxococcota bacterium]|nr:hypothetical protein [Myxococcota bacterium]
MIALLACTTLHTVDGARTLEPGQVQVGAVGSVQGRQNAASVATGIPIAQGELAFRVGLVEDVDIGTRVYIGGLYADLRYRFAQRGRWHFAVAPGMGGMMLPIPALPAGVLDFRVPVRATRELGDIWDLSAGVTPMGRRQLGAFDTYLGTNGRIELRLPHFYLGAGFDWYMQPAYGYKPAWVIGMDLGFRGRSSAERR